MVDYRYKLIIIVRMGQAADKGALPRCLIYNLGWGNTKMLYFTVTNFIPILKLHFILKF